MAARLDDVVRYLDSALEVQTGRDYGPNGLQVEGRPTVERVVTGVTISMALLEQAVARRADAVVVHHGLIWGSGLERVTGVTARRLGLLLTHNISLLAYHLPLDRHPRLGNNAGLADALGLPAARQAFGEVRGQPLGIWTDLETPLPRAELTARVQAGVLEGAAPQFVFPYGPETIRRVGLCSGGGGDLLEAAARAGCDAFITGELAERAHELARELRLTLVAAGHYRTEVFGPSRLAVDLAAAFPGLVVEFVDVPSPL